MIVVGATILSKSEISILPKIRRILVILKFLKFLNLLKAAIWMIYKVAAILHKI